MYRVFALGGPGPSWSLIFVAETEEEAMRVANARACDYLDVNVVGVIACKQAAKTLQYPNLRRV